MRGMSHTPSEAVRIVARAHARLVDRGAHHDSALRLVADQYGQRLQAARWAVATSRKRATPMAHHAHAPRTVVAAVPPAPAIEPISARAPRASAG